MNDQPPGATEGWTRPKVAVITGASQGIGRAIALRLAARGDDLVLCYRHATKAMDTVAAECDELSGRPPLVVQGDLGATATAREICAQATKRFQSIHTLINNAGVANDDLLATLTDEALEDMVATNIIGLVRLSRAVLPTMLRQRAGCIINLSSVLAQKPARGNAVYAGTKGFVESFTRALAVEVGKKMVRVNAVAPGVVETRMSQGVLAVARESILAHIALRRLGTAEDVAELVCFLSSDEAAYINGAVIPIDGALGAW